MDAVNTFTRVAVLVILVLKYQSEGIPGIEEQQKHDYICPNSQLSCRGRCATEKQLDFSNATEVHCHCDPSCHEYQDCCQDIETACPNRTTPPPPSINYECRKLNEEEPSMWMVEQCPLHYKDNPDIIKKCTSNDEYRVETFFDQIPVLYYLNFMTYKNKWCAICNGALLQFISYLNLRTKCNVYPAKTLNFTQSLDYIFAHCNRLQFDLDRDVKRRYCFKTINSCPANSSAEETKACLQSPTRVVYDIVKEKNYRSIECMACHATPEQLRLAVCGPRRVAQNVFKPSSFEVVMNFQPTPTGLKKSTNTHVSCDQSGLVYDSKLEICRREKTGPTQGVSDKVRILLWLKPLDGQVPQNFSNEDFTKVLTRRFVDLDPDQVDVKYIKVEDLSTTVMFDLHAKYHGKDVNKTSTKDLELDMLFNFNKSFEMVIVNRPWLVFKATATRLSCSLREEYPPSNWSLPSEEFDIAKVNVKGTLELVPKHKFFLMYEKDKPFRNLTLVICRSFFSVLCNHSMLSLVEQEYTIFENKSLLFKPTGQWYNEGEYDMRGKTPWICTNYSIVSNNVSTIETQAHKPDIHFTIRRYMTIVGLTISIICLFLVLLTHGILRDLRTPLPGKNLMSLSLSLFLAHFWYLLSSGDTDKPVFCRFSAYILHYLFLVSFGCTFIVAYDTRRTFSAKTAKSHTVGSFQRKRLAAYLMISWGIPFLFVTICAILDGLDVVAIGYGKGQACWISNPTALLIVFATPVGLVLVYNVVAFSQTVYAINSARKHGQRIKSNHYTRTAIVKIYMRLISLMGFSWFFAFSASLIHSALMYPFVFFTTLQGLYIFLAFVLKTKVLRMLKTRLPLQKRKPRRTSKSGTISTMADSTPYNKYTQSSSKDDTQI